MKDKLIIIVISFIVMCFIALCLWVGWKTAEVIAVEAEQHAPVSVQSAIDRAMTNHVNQYHNK